MRILFLTVLSVLLISSCTTQEKKSGELLDLSVTIKTFRAESDGGCQSDTALCAYFEVRYPVFPGLSESINAAIKDSINKKLGFEDPDIALPSFEAKGRQFINNFEYFRDAFNEDAIGWYFQSEVHVELAIDTLLSLSVRSEFFTGGAHGGYTTFFININPQTGEAITLSTVLKPGYAELLRQEGEKAFREVRVLDADAPFSENGFEFSGEQFVLNGNYGFRSEGIVFYFNTYEIAPYVLGPTEFVIPYEAIASVLR